MFCFFAFALTVQNECIMKNLCMLRHSNIRYLSRHND